MVDRKVDLRRAERRYRLPLNESALHTPPFVHDSTLDLHDANMCHGNLKTMQSYANPSRDPVSAQLISELLVRPDQDRGSDRVKDRLIMTPQMQNQAVKLAYGLMLTVAIAALALAQESAQQPSARQQLEHIHIPQSIDQELARLTKDLELTQEQQQQVGPLLQDHHNRIQALLDKNPNASRQNLGQRIHAISEETHREIHALLDDHQKELERAMQQRARFD